MDRTLAAVQQSGEWQCAAASTAWLLDSIGVAASQDEVVNNLGAGRISPDIGLHDGSGAGLVAMLGSSYGVSASNQAIGYDDALSLADRGVFVMGGSAFNHWVGCRGRDSDTLLLANPAPGYRGVGQSMSRDQFAQLGPFYAVSVTGVSAADSGTPLSLPALPDVSGWLPWVAGGAAVAWALGWL